MRRSKRQLQYYGPGIVAVGAAVVLLLLGPLIVSRLTQARSSLRVQVAGKQLLDNDVLSQMNDAVQNVARAVEPSVVHITVAKDGDYMFPLSTGSGWIYDEQGHIITNHHVIDKNGEIEVQFYDGARLRATRVGSDERTDVAVIRVENHPVIAAGRATGQEVRQGDLVFAFGSPFGFQFSMSTGVVSGEGRVAGLSLREAGYESYIQTDAAINPGNSGGPLTNVRGEVIGMNFAMAVSPDGSNRRNAQYINSGVGLAIPLEIVEFVADQIIETGRVQRGGLGVEFRNLTRIWQDELEYHASGIRIEYVLPNSPAEAAGLRSNDVITSVDGRSVINRESFRALAHARSPGEQLVLGVWRKRQGQPGEELEIAVILGKWDDEGNTALLSEQSPLRDSVELDELGITVITLAGDRLDRLGFSGLQNGVYLQAVRLGSLADDLGLRAGHVIVTIDGESLVTPGDFMRILASDIVHSEGVDLELVDPDGVRHLIRLRVP